MPRQNRVQPDGTILAHPARGVFLGNRGVLHNETAHSHGQLTHRRWRHKAWVCCVLSFKNRRRALMTPNRYTELFFHDEAVALAAGHRPCGECRRPDFNAYLAAACHSGKVTEFDTRLHASRAVPRTYAQRHHSAEAADLPDGTFLKIDHGAALLWQDALLPFAPSGYGAPRRRPTGTVTVITPEPTLIALREGFIPTVRLSP